MTKNPIEYKEVPDGVQDPSEIQAAIKKETDKLSKRFLETTIENEIAIKPKTEKSIVPITTPDPFKNADEMDTFTDRTSQETPTKEDGQTVISKKLAIQLGTAPRIIMSGDFDDYKLGNFTSIASALAIVHFERRGIHDGVGYYDFISQRMKSVFIGFNGRGRNDILKLAAYTNPGGTSVMEKAQKPNVIARNLFNRSWKQKAQNQGLEVEQ